MRAAALLLLALCWLAAADAFADIIEVRGQGMIDGQIVSEDETSLTFKNGWGEVSTYPKKDVLYVERIGAASKQKVPAKKKESKTTEKKAPRKELGSDMPASPFSADGSSRLVEWVKRSFLEFWAGDPEKFERVASGAVDDAMRVKNGLSGNVFFCITGMILMTAGLLAAAIFGLQLVIAAFEESFVWGFTLVANVLAYYAPMFDGGLQVLFYMPQVATLYFVVRKWSLARSPVIAQLLSLDLALFGFWMLKTSL